MKYWWQRLMRKHVKPIPSDVAFLMKKRLSFIYAFCAWNAFGFLIIQTIRQSYPMTSEEKKKPGLYYARLLQAPDVEVYQMDGLSISNRSQLEGVPELMPKMNEVEEDSVKERPRDPELLSS